jgi:hypothetical protein
MGGSTLGGLSDAENVQLGVVAALIEGLILQPTLYWKNAMAQNLPVSLNPFIRSSLHLFIYSSLPVVLHSPHDTSYSILASLLHYSQWHNLSWVMVQ